MLLTDVHAHLTYFSEEELVKVVENAIKSDVKVIISNGLNLEDNEKTLKIAEKYDIVKSALGIYPNMYEKLEENIELIRKNKDKIIAIGEVGMDFKQNENVEEQKNVFERVIKIGEELKKPIIIHSRQAEKEVIEILETFNAKKIVMHCFTGKKKFLLRAKENGYYFTVPTNVVKSKQIQDIVNHVNMDRLFTETDCPYLSPYPDKKNEPAFVIESVKKIAEIKKMDAEEVANNIFKNYQQLFL